MDLELQKALYELFKSNLKFPFYDGLRDEVGGWAKSLPIL